MEDKDYFDDAPLVPLTLDNFKDDYKNDEGPLVPLDLEKLKNYNGKICPQCGREYEHDDDSLFCEEDGTKLIEIWKCRHCGEDLTKAQGYSEINLCPNCGKALDSMQKKSINGTKSGEANVLKRICTNEKCGASYENSTKFCGKCGSPVVPMQCSCGENFRQRPDSSFDKYCPVCGKPNPIEQEKQKKEEEEKERQHREWINSLKNGDTIKFGSYPYEADGTEKPIEWIILEKYSDGTALVISKYGLDAVRFDKKSGNWEKSEIRHWLNNDFYNRAFSEIERKQIIESVIECVKKGLIWDDNYTVKDKIILLSIKEAEKYFSSDRDRICLATPYAETNKTETVRPVITFGGSCWWWLRSPNIRQDHAALVCFNGVVDSYGQPVFYDYYAVRVALKINLKNL